MALIDFQEDKTREMAGHDSYIIQRCFSIANHKKLQGNQQRIREPGTQTALTRPSLATGKNLQKDHPSWVSNLWKF